MTPIWILLLLQLQLTREEDAYVQKGQDRELPCGLVESLPGTEEVTWSYNAGVPGSSSVPLFRGAAGQAQKEAEARERLSVFRNHSLYLRGAEDGDTGTYWCSVQGDTRNTYHLKVVTGTQMVLTTGHTNMTCHQFSCAILDRQALPAVTWRVDGQRAQDTDRQGRHLVFSGSRAALLQACWNTSDQGARKKKKRVKCEVNGLQVTFNLAGKDPPAPNMGGPACSSAWIPLAVCAALEFLLLLALGAALWRRGQPDRRSHLDDLPANTQPDPPGPKSQTQLYENVGLGWDTQQGAPILSSHDGPVNPCGATPAPRALCRGPGGAEPRVNTQRPPQGGSEAP
ncbi:lymphocyte antigen 6 complex locus protein G6f isoform X1 [Malaclemys terrapin pileata]|uniref:lymphocyte antigen 6 complex locus protein G6f isoform X1 n=1 Tax=Malaclemys terrapin pileata TaxID=2991368 RepID=UPI0023A90F56|nr:lymphocyte antigen 6 complex locus protein G6f isoform X1 [Malaclemys terrapin pileata]